MENIGSRATRVDELIEKGKAKGVLTHIRPIRSGQY